MLKRNLGKKGLVGLDIGSSSVKAVELQGKPGSLSLTNLGFENLQPDTVVDGQIMELNDVSNVIAGIFRDGQIKTDRVAAGVSGSSVIVKNIIVPQMTREELEESIDWHAEEHIPFDIGDVSLDYQVVGSGADSLHVLMAACKRDSIANIRQAIQLAGKQPAIIDVDAFALQNCYEVNYQPPDDLIVALLNVGASTMNINILKGVRSVFTRDVSVGGNQYTALLQKELGLTYEQAEAVKRGGAPPSHVESPDTEGVLETVSDLLALEISKTFDFFRATAEDS
ncbi:MAG: pilus assembly protein PilM, partial [Acidobacteria bacterium]|nr:pilus assembly protein PilM [Acidobacteriota bacterium]